MVVEQSTDRGGHPPQQDDYLCVVLRKGPYFQGWRPCSMAGGGLTKNNSKRAEEMATNPIADMEDFITTGDPCHHDCSVVQPQQQQQQQSDDQWYIPRQRNVNNDAYTSRRDQQLGRGRTNPMGTPTVVAVIVVVAALVVGLLWK